MAKANKLVSHKLFSHAKTQFCLERRGPEEKINFI